MNKKLVLRIFLSFVLTLALAFPLIVFAQAAVSNCFVTKVGNATGAPILPAGCKTSGNTPNNLSGGVTGPCGSVIEWAQKTADSLVVGGGGYKSGDGYDNRTQDFTSPCGSSLPRSEWDGQYWCTYLVIDAYTLAGIGGVSNDKGDAGVPAMHAHWDSLPGFYTLDYGGGPNQDTIQKVRPGFAIFFGDNDHVGLVKSITYDEHGNGTLETYESNSSAPSHKWPISEWKVINGFTISLFGGHN